MSGERLDFARIARWINPGARVLDLGCEDGAMIAYLTKKRGANGVGVDINPANLTECLRRGVAAVQADINDNLSLFADDSFDVVVLSQTLQSIKRGIGGDVARWQRSVSFPRYAFASGKMPSGRRLPYQWHDTPRYCTIRDFEELCRGEQIKVADRVFFSGTADITTFPNARADGNIRRLTFPPLHRRQRRE